MSAKAVLGRALRETGAALKEAGGVEVRAGSRTRHRKDVQNYILVEVDNCHLELEEDTETNYFFF